MYNKYLKRLLDFLLSLIAIIVLLPFLIVFTIIGYFAMKGNPFFTQLRPGKDERIFKLIKFRTMTCEKDKNGKLLPDDERVTKYGKFLRSTSIDELPELFNILVGDMSIVGPRPLLPEYIQYYTEEEKHRHDVRPGLTGLAQVNGRNFIKWDDKLALDVKYVKNITFLGDIKILCLTVYKVLKRADVLSKHDPNAVSFIEQRKRRQLESQEREEVISNT